MKQQIGLGLSIGVVIVGLTFPVVTTAQKKTTAKPTANSASPSFDKDVKPLIEKYCVDCHSDKAPPGGVLLTKGMQSGAVAKNGAMWQRVAKNVALKTMPPEGTPQPTDAQRKQLTNWIDSQFVQDCKLADPGRVTLRRLNREEYNNTVRDLLGVSIRPADDFPSDDVGYGFDNIGDVLSMSSLLMEKYLSASEKVMKSAIRLSKTKTRTVVGSELKFVGGAAHRDNFLGMFSNSTGSTNFKVDQPGWYRIRVVAGGSHAGNEAPKLDLKLNRDKLTTFDIAEPMATQHVYEYPIKLVAGDWGVNVSYTNDFYDQATKKDRNVTLYSVSLIGPVEDNAVRTDFQKRYIPTVPAPDQYLTEGRKLLENFGSRAYRRPITKEELDRLMNVFNLGLKSGEGYERAVQLAGQALLCNPNFLYRVELDVANNAKSRVLNPYEFASRLSYFLWSSAPDDELFALAKTGDILKPEVSAAQVKRMLASPKAEALVHNFGLQWLQLRKLAIFEPDKKMFPTYTPELVNAMVTETSMFFDGIMRENRPITEFIDSNYTYLNEQLASHYGITGVSGENFRKVSTAGTGRGGVLTQASVLTITSNPTRTSPTKRGKWILEQILGSPPPPPPPGVGDLSDDKHITDKMTLRQQLEEHRKNPACASCHTRMDALGFGFEAFSPVGQVRTKIGPHAIDATATLPGGKKFNGATQLKTILLENKKEFAHNFAEKMMTFALGRGTYESDKCFIDDAVKNATANEYRFASVVQSIVNSKPFRERTTEGAKK